MRPTKQLRIPRVSKKITAEERTIAHPKPPLDPSEKDHNLSTYWDESEDDLDATSAGTTESEKTLRQTIPAIPAVMKS